VRRREGPPVSDRAEGSAQHLRGEVLGEHRREKADYGEVPDVREAGRGGGGGGFSLDEEMSFAVLGKSNALRVDRGEKIDLCEGSLCKKGRLPPGHHQNRSPAGEGSKYRVEKEATTLSFLEDAVAEAGRI